MQQPAGHPPAEPSPNALHDVAVDRRAEIPVGTQIVWALRARIGDGRLAHEERLPGVRELAEMFKINANTARAVYQRLEREGLIESRQGTGTFVARSTNRRTGVGQLAAEAARQAREVGVNPRELATALYVTSEDEQPAAGSGDRRRRQLQAQIAALDQALSEIDAHNPRPLPASAPAPGTGSQRPPTASTSAPGTEGPRLLSAAELEDVRGRLVRRLTDAQLALDARTSNTANKRTSASERPSKQAQGSQRPAVKAPKRRASPTPTTRPSTA